MTWITWFAKEIQGWLALSMDGFRMPVMHTYRCYLFDPSDHIASVEVVECHDDHAAKRRAHDILPERPRFSAVEVWQLARRVNREP